MASILTRDGNIKKTISDSELQELSNRLAGDRIQSGDESYDTVRQVWNGMVDRYPALIARCADPEDVIAGVNFARIHGVLLAVRGGGHNVAGYATCDGGDGYRSLTHERC